MNAKNNKLQQVVDTAMVEARARLTRYREKFLEVKKSLGDKIGYFILIREDNQVQLVGYVSPNGAKSLTQGNVNFQLYLREAATARETVIVTVGETIVRPDEYTGRVYLPSHIDAYEHHRVVRDVTGFIL